jgi:hypothetical protein
LRRRHLVVRCERELDDAIDCWTFDEEDASLLANESDPTAQR